MTMKNFLLALSLISLAGCNGKDDPAPQTAGKGGAATLRVTTRHHTKLIDSCMVYIKYNASSLPASFDDSARVSVSRSDTLATFAGLKAGKYYLYGKGWDRQLAKEVVGGFDHTISSEVVQNVTVYVTEGD